MDYQDMGSWDMRDETMPYLCTKCNGPVYVSDEDAYRGVWPLCSECVEDRSGGARVVVNTSLPTPLRNRTRPSRAAIEQLVLTWTAIICGAIALGWMLRSAM